MYFNKKRWKLYLRYRTNRMFMICEDMHLLNWFYYLTHTEEEIWAFLVEALIALEIFPRIDAGEFYAVETPQQRGKAADLVGDSGFGQHSDVVRLHKEVYEEAPVRCFHAVFRDIFRADFVPC